MRNVRNLAFALLTATVLVTGTVEIEAYVYDGACSLTIDLGGAGACANEVYTIDPQAQDWCGGSCGCYCISMINWASGGNPCSQNFENDCDLDGPQYCLNQDQTGCDESTPCCSGLSCSLDSRCVTLD